MKLTVLPDVPPAPRKQPWYADGLNFTCTQCGNCCTGGPGYVWITKDEIAKLAAHLHLTPEETVDRYCRKIDGEFSLNEVRNAQGSYDCVFLNDERNPRGRGGNADGDRNTGTDGHAEGGANAVVHARRSCSVYGVRPLQCRTWPFWPENLSSRRSWDAAAKKCHGMNVGRPFTPDEIHAVRDANDWPKNPPTSG